MLLCQGFPLAFLLSKYKLKRKLIMKGNCKYEN